MENYKLPITSSFDKFLILLKRSGPLSTAAIAAELGITAEGARLQLTKRASDGLVVRNTMIKGVGRPVQVWQLTDKGNHHFPDFHAELSVQLMEAVRENLGEEAVTTIVKSREQKIVNNYCTALQGIINLQEKIDRLTQLRSEEGYLASWEKEGTGFILKENHCPICTAATACHEFCQSDLDIFQQVLGPHVAITRLDHILSGSSHCAYQITPVDALPSS